MTEYTGATFTHSPAAIAKILTKEIQSEIIENGCNFQNECERISASIARSTADLEAAKTKLAIAQSELASVPGFDLEVVAEAATNAALAAIEYGVALNAHSFYASYA